MFKSNPMQKETFKGQFVCSLGRKYEKRGLQLIPQASRCLIANESTEMILTDEDKNRRQCKQNSIYRVFAVKKHRNYCGDEVKINGQVIGKIAGFDETHVNHTIL